MKPILIFLFIISNIGIAFSQTSGNARVDALIKQQKQAKSGQFLFTVNGQKFTEKVNVIKSEKSYGIIGDLMESTRPLTILFQTFTSGKHELNSDKNVIGIHDKIYIIKGFLDLKSSGNQASGTVSGTLFEINSKGKTSPTSSGNISGTLSGLIVNQ
ncbi:hypothetical protein LV89_01269 [Arcicella aurantiaca]|uniref:FecR family protein n=1 Tax=Arcicella aurantiaca TaxID=591202 RepID=A0A316EE06_9BACT|nr:hypothetical protein [Arcicella aurantiaca]PWK27862.1 hypothetical protein LV89_01269 [Arcicella aurantiaca]